MKTRMQLLRGATQLAGEGFFGVLGSVEAMHRAIGNSLPVPGAGLVDRATGFVYRRVRDVGRAGVALARGSLGLLERRGRANDAPLSAGQMDWLAALNGAVGDHLQDSDNPLAIEMALCRDGRACTDAMLRECVDNATGTLFVLVHGLGMHDQQWRGDDGTDFGQQLQHDLGGCALTLRYNSGRRISANGRDFADLMQALRDAHGSAIRRIVLIGHSMGGLVCRSACAHAARQRLDWLDKLSDVVCLGSPHRGAPLERAGNGLSTLLAATPYTRSLSALAEARSAGVKDLRHGWAGDLDRDDSIDAAHDGDSPALPARVRVGHVAATLSPKTGGARSRWLGDGLVPVPSALDQSASRQPASGATSVRRQVFHAMGHLQLLHDARVYTQLHAWLKD